MPKGAGGRPPREEPGISFEIRISTALNNYLQDLVAHGVDGSTRQEVVRQMIADGVRARIRDGYLTVRARPGGTDQ